MEHPVAPPLFVTLSNHKSTLSPEFKSALALIKDDSTEEMKTDLVKMAMRWSRMNYPDLFKRDEPYEPPPSWKQEPF